MSADGSEAEPCSFSSYFHVVYQVWISLLREDIFWRFPEYSSPTFNTTLQTVSKSFTTVMVPNESCLLMRRKPLFKFNYKIVQIATAIQVTTPIIRYLRDDPVPITINRCRTEINSLHLHAQTTHGVIVSTFDDRCVDLRRSMIDVSTFED